MILHSSSVFLGTFNSVCLINIVTTSKKEMKKQVQYELQTQIQWKMEACVLDQGNIVLLRLSDGSEGVFSS